MAPPDLENRILEIVRVHNERNEPIGKKMIYNEKLAAITTVQKAIKSLEADGRLVEHMVTLPRGTFCMLMVSDGTQAEDVKRQKVLDMSLYHAMAAVDRLDRLQEQMDRIEGKLNELKGASKT